MKLPTKWTFDSRPVCNFARTLGMSLEVRHVDGRYYRAELLIEDPQPSVSKRSWIEGVWCHRSTEAEAIAAVEQLAIAAGIVEPR